jgi:hypothetical protein
MLWFLNDGTGYDAVFRKQSFKIKILMNLLEVFAKIRVRLSLEKLERRRTSRMLGRVKSAKIVCQPLSSAPRRH